MSQVYEKSTRGKTRRYFGNCKGIHSYQEKKNFIQSIECVTYSHPLKAITYYLLMSQNNSSADALLKGCLELFLDKISGHLRDKIFKFQGKKQKLCY